MSVVTGKNRKDFLTSIQVFCYPFIVFMTLDWDKIFSEASGSLSIQNAKPTHESSRNIFKDDKNQIMTAANKYNYQIISPPMAKVVSFVKIIK